MPHFLHILGDVQVASIHSCAQLVGDCPVVVGLGVVVVVVGLVVVVVVGLVVVGLVVVAAVVVSASVVFNTSVARITSVDGCFDSASEKSSPSRCCQNCVTSTMVCSVMFVDTSPRFFFSPREQDAAVQTTTIVIRTATAFFIRIPLY